ncbi:hypothetical protein BH11MYX1_BH11MYX1_09160 [soil metagenome]
MHAARTELRPASPDIVLAGCWAHVYRRFEEAEPDHPDAERALAWIGALYETDRVAGDDAHSKQNCVVRRHLQSSTS